MLELHELLFKLAGGWFDRLVGLLFDPRLLLADLGATGGLKELEDEEQSTLAGKQLALLVKRLATIRSLDHCFELSVQALLMSLDKDFDHLVDRLGLKSCD